MLFPAGAHAIWRIDSYVRKIAFLRLRAPRLLILPLIAWTRLSSMAKMWLIERGAGGPANVSAPPEARGKAKGDEATA
jgi:hypothetical protein